MGTAANSERRFKCPFSSAPQDFLPGIGNIQSDGLRVVEGVYNISDIYLLSDASSKVGPIHHLS